MLKAPGATFTGDVTPSYATLETRTLRQIRTEFEKRGVAVKAFFVMRDPVERCWSHFRMLVKNGKAEKLFAPVHDMAAQFPQFCRSQEAMLRTGYPETIDRLREVFAEDEIQFGFFETMFEAAEIERLSAFLDVPARTQVGSVRVHSGASRSLREDSRAAARAVLEPIYARTQAHFPQTL